MIQSNLRNDEHDVFIFILFLSYLMSTSLTVKLEIWSPKKGHNPLTYIREVTQKIASKSQIFISIKQLQLIKGKTNDFALKVDS